MRRLALPTLVSFLTPFAPFAPLALLPGCVFDALAYDEDEGPPDPPLPPPVWARVGVQTEVEPALVMMRVGNAGEWKAMEQLSATRFQATPNQVYTVAVVCLRADGDAITTMRSDVPTRAPIVLHLSCAEEAKPFMVRGTMVQPGSVSLDGARASSSQAGWSFALPARAGHRDLIAASDERVLVQRDLQISGDVTVPLPPLDLAQQGVALIERPFEMITLPGETARATTYLSTERSPAVEIHRGPVPKVLPFTAQVAGDQTTLRFSTERRVGGRTSQRIAEMMFGAMSASRVSLVWEPFVQLQQRHEALGEVATWQPLGVELPGPMQLEVADDEGRRITHLATAAYLEQPRERSLSTIIDAPAYLPAWRIDPARPYTRTVESTRRGVSTEVIERHRVEERVDAGPIISAGAND